MKVIAVPGSVFGMSQPLLRRKATRRRCAGRSTRAGGAFETTGIRHSHKCSFKNIDLANKQRKVTIRWHYGNLS